MNYRQYISDLSVSLAEAAWTEYYRNLHELLYVCGRRGVDGVYRGLRVAADWDEGEELVICDPLPRHLTKDAMVGWVRERLRRSPVLAPELNLE